MNCWLLSGRTVDPTLHVVSDIRSRLQTVDVDSRMTSTMSYTDDDWTTTDLPRRWSFDGVDDDGDERCSAPWLPYEQHQPAVNWCVRERSTSPTFSVGDHQDELSHDVWSLGPSSLLDNDDDDARSSRSTLGEWPACGSYCCHTTNTCIDDRCSSSRCPSRGAASVDACSPKNTSTSSDGMELADSVPSSSLDDVEQVVSDEWTARAWKRRRRRRRSRRWSRRHQPSLITTSQHVTRQLNADLDSPSHILRSMLLHGCSRRPASYRASSTKSVVSPGSVVARHAAVTGSCSRLGGAAAYRRQTVCAPLIDRRLTAEPGDAETTRHRCLEDHCYFSRRKEEAAIDYSRISRCKTVRVSTVLI